MELVISPINFGLAYHEGVLPTWTRHRHTFLAAPCWVCAFDSTVELHYPVDVLKQRTNLSTDESVLTTYCSSTQPKKLEQSQHPIEGESSSGQSDYANQVMQGALKAIMEKTLKQGQG